jgi:hypothetical protein
MVAVRPSMAVAEQYFSWDSATARSTAAGGRSRPVTTKCRFSAVKTLGSVAQPGRP